jgi:universal stress protein A
MKVKPSKNTGKVLVEMTDTDMQFASEPLNKHKQPVKIKTILVPTDFSSESKKALRYAVSFAEQFGAGIILLHVLEQPIYPAELGYTPVEFPKLQDSLTSELKARLKAIVDEDLQLSFDVESVVQMGQVFQTIDGVAKEKNVDLIIIATHGYTGLKHALLGSTAEKVVRYAPCPVLVVREQEHDFVH